jgi:GT2 family glycosyltransferase
MPAAKIPQVSVIISNFNGARYLPRLFETLNSQVGVDLEIIVVDRNSVDESDAILARHPEVKVIKHPPETGLVCGYAVGADSASHALLFCCNEDMWFEPHCLRLLCDKIDLGNRIASVMPVQWTYDLKDIVACGAWFEKSCWCPSNPYPFRVSRWHLVSGTQSVSCVNAGACLIHRAAYDDIGGWDRSFFLDYEDMDLCVRLWQHEWKCLVVTEAKVGHAVGASNNKSIQGGKFKVSRKRYIEGSANVSAIAIKTFTGVSMVWPFVGLLDRMLRNLVHLRFERVWWDVLVFDDVLKRLPDLLAFRSQNKRWNLKRPGQRYFTSPEFDYSVIANNHAA